MIKSMQDEYCGKTYVEFVKSWQSPLDEETDCKSILPFMELLPSHQRFDLQLKSPNIRPEYAAIAWSMLDKKFSKPSEYYDGER